MQPRSWPAIATFALAFVVSGSLSAAVRNEMIVSTEWLAEKPAGRVIVIDVAVRSDYQASHIPGARLLEPKQFIRDFNGIADELPAITDLEAVFERLGVGDSDRIILYSRQPLLATRAWFTLDYLGHGHRASVLDGGFAKWVTERRPTTTKDPTFSARPFNAEPSEASVTTFEAMKKHLAARNTPDAPVFVDARPAHQYAGATPGPGVPRTRAGHIPSAINIPWRLNLEADGDGSVFKPASDLETLYACFERDQTLIAYCRTGMEASMTYFVLRYLGFTPSLYDGSFTEWSNSATPVV